MDQAEPLTPPYPGTKDSGILCPLDAQPPCKACAHLGLSPEMLSAAAVAAAVCTSHLRGDRRKLFVRGVDKACSSGLCVHTCCEISLTGMELEMKREAAINSHHHSFTVGST